MKYRIKNPAGFITGNISLSSSKSESNRVLMIKALCNDQNFLIENLSDSDDTRIIIEAFKSKSGQIDCHNAGTALRFLTAYFATQKGSWLITGNDRMKHRPIEPLVTALNEIGADISFTEKNGFPPVRINGMRLRSGIVDVRADISSQFISALLMLGPILPDGIQVNLMNRIGSKPYINTTLEIMRRFGAVVEWNDNSIQVAAKPYMDIPYVIENDWSSASFWYLAAMISSGSDLSLPLMKKDSIQGDSIIYEIMNNLGVQTQFLHDKTIITRNDPVDFPAQLDFTNCPDLAQPITVAFAVYGKQLTLTGLGSLRIKETDRVHALCLELTKMGTTVEEGKDYLKLLPRQEVNRGSFSFNVYGDHRMAMSLAMVALRADEVFIENPGVVTKSYSRFWADMKTAGFEVTEV